MKSSLIFWILMLFWLVFGVWSTWPNYKAAGGNILTFLLFLILGWKAFGGPVQ